VLAKTSVGLVEVVKYTGCVVVPPHTVALPLLQMSRVIHNQRVKPLQESSDAGSYHFIRRLFSACSSQGALFRRHKSHQVDGDSRLTVHPDKHELLPLLLAEKISSNRRTSSQSTEAWLLVFGLSLHVINRETDVNLTQCILAHFCGYLF